MVLHLLRMQQNAVSLRPDIASIEWAWSLMRPMNGDILAVSLKYAGINTHYGVI